MKVSNKNHTQVLLLAIFVGFLGVHRFVVGKTGTGVLWLLTLGLFGVGWLVDVIWLLGNCFDDWDGAVLVSEKGKKRIAEQGRGAERNAVPEVFCWIFMVIGLASAALRIYMLETIGTNIGGFLWCLSYVVSFGYPLAIAWIISSKGLE